MYPLVSLEYIAAACPMTAQVAGALDGASLFPARLSAGSRMLTSRAMMPMTTSNSTSVKADVRRRNMLSSDDVSIPDRLPEGCLSLVSET